jgi:hypothetical protein
MMTAFGEPLKAGTGAARALVAAGLTPGDWVNIGVGLAGVLAVVGVAWIQRRQSRRDQRAERVRQIQRLNITSRRLRHDIWHWADFTQMREILDLGDDLVSGVLEQGPLSAENLELLGIEQFRVRTAQLSNRIAGPPAKSMRELSNLATRLARTGVARDGSDPAYPNRLADATCSRDLQRLAILQDRTARELNERILATRSLAEREWVI